MQKIALVTVTLGEDYARLSSLTHPTFKAYAQRIGADFVVIDSPVFKSKSHDWEKFQVKNLLNTYDRIILLDSDIIIREDAPSLFKVIPNGWFGAFNIGEHFVPTDLKEFAKLYKLPAPSEWGSRYYSSGVLVFDKSHAQVFEDPEQLSAGSVEQWLNYQLNKKVKTDSIKDIWARFNRMPFFDSYTLYSRFEFYFIHYANVLKDHGISFLEDVIKGDLKIWEQLKPKYCIPKAVKVLVGGGLGDEVAAEPVIREIRRLHPHEHLIVESHWKELWEDLPYKVDEIVSPGTPTPEDCLQPIYYTYAGPNLTTHQMGMTHATMSSTDLSAYLSLLRPLPPEKREIKIGWTKKQEESMLKKLGVTKDWLKSAVILHPGLTWPTRTVPTEIWQETINLLLTQEKHIVVIGKGGEYQGPKRGSDVIGILDFKVSDPVIDARNKLSVKETLALLGNSHILVSNDSAPIHLAGATDIWILGIFTTKHSHFVLPYRHQDTWYKAAAINNCPDCWPCGVNAIRAFPEGLRMDHCLNYDNPYSCMPSAKKIVESILEIPC